MDLIKEINSKNLGWTATYYDQFMGQKLQKAFDERLGTLYPRYVVSKTNRMANYKNIHNYVAPKIYSASKKWPGAVSMVTDQGWCNNSWVVSTANVASDKLSFLIESKVLINASDILECTRTQHKCNANSLNKAWTYLNKGL